MPTIHDLLTRATWVFRASPLPLWACVPGLAGLDIRSAAARSQTPSSKALWIRLVLTTAAYDRNVIDISVGDNTDICVISLCISPSMGWCLPQGR